LRLSYLLDTSIVSAAVSKVPNVEVLRRLEAHGLECAIASVVWHELVFGVGRLQPSKRKAALEVYLHEVVRTSFPILPYDERAAHWQALERVRLEGAGTPQPFVDGQIAAIAHSNDLVLVTANTKDFRHYSGLKLEDWTRKHRVAR
jgi:tRNA(fMet)-specific endonuclease VapC